MKTLVIAGNRQQADQWIKSNLDKRAMSGVTTLSWSDYIVVTDAMKIKGISNPTGVFIGTWMERADLEPIFQQLLISTDITTNKHRVINDLWGQWKTNRPKPKPKRPYTAQEAINDAAKMLSDAIDQEVMDKLLKKINGGKI